MPSLAPPAPLAPAASTAVAARAPSGLFPSIVDALAAPVRALDRARLAWLRALGPVGRVLVRDRELRVAVVGCSLVLASLLGAVLFPLWMLALGPILWGVPHVLSDVRYLVVRPGLHRRPALAIAVGVPLLLLAFTSEPAFGFAAAVAAALVARGSVPRRLAVAAPLAVLTALAHRDAFVVALVFAHAHNLVALALFAGWRGRRGRSYLLPIALFFAGAALIMGGAFDGIVSGVDALFGAPFGMHVFYHLDSLAPGLDGALGFRLVLLFAFAQSVHYVVWVRLIPEEDRPRDTPRPFMASLRVLREELGLPVVCLTALAMLGLAVWATADLIEARAGYLRAVLFHGYLEVAVAAIFVVEAARPTEVRARA